MEPIFTINYAEFLIVDLLSKRFKSSDGYSLFIPASRQEKGIDLLLTKRCKSGLSCVSFQVKASRIHIDWTRKKKQSNSCYYHTWFNCFQVPDEADFIMLCTLYPEKSEGNDNVMASKWTPLILIFSNKAMKQFIDSIKTVQGKPDRMFGFGIYSPNKIVQTRGDQKRRQIEFTDHLLENQWGLILKALD